MNADPNGPRVRFLRVGLAQPEIVIVRDAVFHGGALGVAACPAAKTAPDEARDRSATAKVAMMTEFLGRM